MPGKGTRYYAGIDPSLSGTAVVLIDPQGRVREAVTIRPKSTGVERLAELLDATWAVLDREGRDRIALVAVEGYAYGGTHQRGIRAVAEWGGVLRLSLYRARLPYIEIPPASAKKYATGRGDAPKDRIALAVYKRWAVELGDEHQTDAYVLARIARDMDCAGQDELTAVQRDIIRRLTSEEGVEEHGA